MARRFAELSVLALGTDIVLVSERTGATVADAAVAFFAVLDLFKLGRVIEEGNAIVLADTLRPHGARPRAGQPAPRPA